MALVAAAAANQKQQKASIGRRAWRLLRLAVLWVRKGSAVHSLCLFSNLRRAGVGLGVVGGGGRSERLRYGEPEYSIEETPSARVLCLIPCIAPAVPNTPGFYGDEDRYFFCRWDTEPECSSVGCYDYIENNVLKTEQIVQVRHGARGDVTILPTLVINNVQYSTGICFATTTMVSRVSAAAWRTRASPTAQWTSSSSSCPCRRPHPPGAPHAEAEPFAAPLRARRPRAAGGGKHRGAHGQTAE
ncbi:uncharacterized protein [Oryza sativa Japonica Group]|uniref:uncharacterized protein n=1 Tax=Oryza sativa subsp. japonica TaxID=39947 RepID=UPI0007754A0C|nr:uncharacterized protein LOC9271800 [Oryza sativa Japonica Group]KAF2953442.1 hypothetical protein DAI22_01g408300 [Oryza sativa Japonica Group]